MSNQPQPSELDVRYGQQASLYASQFLINAGAEEVSLDCCSSVEIANGQTVVPVHTRLAMSWEGAMRLHALLQQAIDQKQASKTAIPAPHIPTGAAKLPSFGETTV